MTTRMELSEIPISEGKFQENGSMAVADLFNSFAVSHAEFTSWVWCMMTPYMFMSRYQFTACLASIFGVWV